VYLILDTRFVSAMLPPKQVQCLNVNVPGNVKRVRQKLQTYDMTNCNLMKPLLYS